MSLLNIVENELNNEEHARNDKSLENNITEDRCAFEYLNLTKFQPVDRQDYKEDYSGCGSEDKNELTDESEDEDSSNNFASFLLGFRGCDAGDINKEIKKRFKVVDNRLKNWTWESDSEDLMPEDTLAGTSTNNQRWSNDESTKLVDNLDEDDVEQFIKINRELFCVTDSELEADIVKVTNVKENKDTSIMNTVFSSIKSYKTLGKQCPQSKYVPNEM